MSKREELFNSLALVSLLITFSAYGLHFVTSDRWTPTLRTVWLVALGLAIAFEAISRVYGRTHVEEQTRRELEEESHPKAVNPERVRLAWVLLWAGAAAGVTAVFVGDFSESGQRVLYVVAFAFLFVSFALTLFRQDG